MSVCCHHLSPIPLTLKRWEKKKKKKKHLESVLFFTKFYCLLKHAYFSNLNHYVFATLVSSVNYFDSPV